VGARFNFWCVCAYASALHALSAGSSTNLLVCVCVCVCLCFSPTRAERRQRKPTRRRQAEEARRRRGEWALEASSFSLPDDVFDDISASFDFCFWGSFEPSRMSKRYGGGGGGGHRSPPDTGPRRNRMFKKRGFICN